MDKPLAPSSTVIHGETRDSEQLLSKLRNAGVSKWIALSSCSHFDHKSLLERPPFLDYKITMETPVAIVCVGMAGG